MDKQLYNFHTWKHTTNFFIHSNILFLSTLMFHHFWAECFFKKTSAFITKDKMYVRQSILRFSLSLSFWPTIKPSQSYYQDSSSCFIPVPTLHYYQGILELLCPSLGTVEYVDFCFIYYYCSIKISCYVSLCDMCFTLLQNDALWSCQFYVYVKIFVYILQYLSNKVNKGH